MKAPPNRGIPFLAAMFIFETRSPADVFIVGYWHHVAQSASSSLIALVLVAFASCSGKSIAQIIVLVVIIDFVGGKLVIHIVAVAVQNVTLASVDETPEVGDEYFRIWYYLPVDSVQKFELEQFEFLYFNAPDPGIE